MDIYDGVGWELLPVLLRMTAGPPPFPELCFYRPSLEEVQKLDALLRKNGSDGCPDWLFTHAGGSDSPRLSQ